MGKDLAQTQLSLQQEMLLIHVPGLLIESVSERAYVLKQERKLAF